MIILIARTGFVFGVFFDYKSSPQDIQSQSFFDSLREKFTQRWMGNFWTKETDDTKLEQDDLSDILSEEYMSGDVNFSSSDRLSLDEIITSINHADMNASVLSSEELAKQYAATNDPQIGIQYITKLSKEFQYKQAYTELMKLDSTTIKTMNPHLVLRIFFNSDLIVPRTQNLTLIENMVGEMSANKLITTQETQWYKWLVTLLKWDQKTFLSNLPVFEKNDTSDIQGVVNDIRVKVRQSTQWHDMPIYYTDGLLALSLFQYGYPYLAQQLSLQLLINQPNYILPKQILAYSHMILHEWSQAQSYFLQLIADDKKNTATYQFFAGVCSYWLEKYTDAIIYLNQIPTQNILSDAIRYKILSYIAIQDRTNTAKQMKYLLWQNDINNSDMMLIREQTVFKPYMAGTDYYILAKDSSIIDLYIERCKNEKFEETICKIWQVAKETTLRTTTYNDTYLTGILSDFPRSYLYYILGEYYLKNNKPTEAQKALISAFSLSTDPIIKNKITTKMKSAL